METAVLCDKVLWGICLTKPPESIGSSLFGFPEFLAALALLILVFIQSDPTYKFRISVAPFHLNRITFASIIVIGVGTLLTDLWFVERWPALPWGISRGLIQAGFGLYFLLVLSLWALFAFICPPKYGRLNCKKYGQALYRIIQKGDESELRSAAPELARSSKNLVKYAPESFQLENLKRNPDAKLTPVSGYARDILLLIGDRKFCREVVKSSSLTAIAIFEEADFQKKWQLTLSQFAKNLTVEALTDTDSVIYHEDSGFEAGLLGHIKPFTRALYGNYRLVEGLSKVGLSPLDISLFSFNPKNFKAYCRLVHMTFEDYLDTTGYGGSSHVLNRAMDIIGGAPIELYQLDGMTEEYYSHDALEKLEISVKFTRKAIESLSKRMADMRKEYPDYKGYSLRLPSEGSFRYKTIFDHISELIFELIWRSSSIQKPADLSWWVQHNTLWGPLFDFTQESEAWRIIRFKLFRLIFDEVKKLESFPNFKGARLLGFCLNVMGLKVGNKNEYGKEVYTLRKAILNWTRKNYLELVQKNPRVGDSCITGTISFDAEHGRLVKTYALGLKQEPNKVYLDLDR